jgi:hypothetical protein
MRRALIVGALSLCACQSALQLPGKPYGCDAGALPADYDAQCASGWRCGLEGVCRPKDGGAYTCTDDSWCDPGWSCTFEHACADQSKDQVAPSSGAALNARRRSPGLTAAPIASIEASFPAELVMPGGQAVIITTATFGRDDGSFVQIDQLQVGFAGITGALTQYGVTNLPWPGDAGPYAVTPGISWRLNNGALEGALPTAMGIVVPVSPQSDGPTTATGLIEAPAPFPIIAAYNDTTLWPFSVKTSMSAPPEVAPLFGNGPPPTFLSPPVSLAAGVLAQSPEPMCVPSPAAALPAFFAVAADGALSAVVPGIYLESVGSMLVPVPTYSVDGGAVRSTISLGFSDGGTLSAARVRVNGAILAVQGTPDSGHDVVLFELADCNQVPSAQAVEGFDTCAVCGADTLVDFWPESTVAGGITAYCRGADGGEYGAVKRVTVGPVGQSCSKVLSNPNQPTSFFDETRTANNVDAPGIAAFAGSHGNLWVGQGLSGLLPFLVPDLPGLAMNGVVGEPDGGPAAPDGGDEGNFFITYSRDGTYADSLFDGGLAILAEGATGDLGMACEIVGPFRTLVLRNGTVSVHTGPPGDMSSASSTVVAQLGDPNVPFNPPFNSVSFFAGGLGLAISANGLILGADVTTNVAAIADGGMPAPLPASLVQKAVLPAGESIVSLVSEPDAGAVSLYALTSSELVHVAGNLSDRWSTAAFTIPPGNPKRLLYANDRLRIAYDDGRVYSATTQLLLAPAADGGVGNVGDFAVYCGDTYALATNGLYRLDPTPGNVTGTWTLAFSPDQLGLTGIGSKGLDKGVLRVADDPTELQLMSGYGALVVIRAASGCQP